MITPNQSKRIGLVLVGTILIIFGLYVLLFNVFLIYKGMNAVEKATVIEASDVPEKIIEVSEKKFFPKSSPPVVGEEIGKLTIPKLNATIPIFHGTAEDQLIQGVGHVIGTALPGEESNSVLSGHRDTVFRKLGEVTKGDILTVENLNGICSRPH